MRKLIKPLLVAALFMGTYLPTFVWMWERWMAKDSDYGHGILVPFICGYLIWQKLRKDKEGIKERIKPSNLGLVLIIGGLFIHLLSAWLQVYFTSGFSMIVTLAGLTVYFFGVRTLKAFAFPILFLVFMMPLPLVAVANISLKMKLFATQIATALVNKIGIPARMSGSMIQMEHSYLMVGYSCSGLRSLISLMALGSLFSYYMHASEIKKTILFAASIPLALISNILRIIFLCFVSEVYGMEYATGFIHDFAGMMVFVLAFLGLLITERMLE